MNHAFSMTDLELFSQFLGLDISQSGLGIKVNRSNYASYILNNFIMNNSNTRKTPFLSGVKLEEVQSTPLENNTLYRQLVCCLLYLNHTQLDIYYEVSVNSRHMDQPHDMHFRAAKRILNFVQGTRTHGIFYAAKYEVESLFGKKDELRGHIL